MAALAKVSREITAHLDLDGVLSRIVESVVGLTDSYYSRLFLYDADEKIIRVRASHGRGVSKPPKDTYRPGEGLTGNAFQKGEPIIVRDLMSIISYLEIDESLTSYEWARKENLNSWIMQPLFQGDEIVGVIH